MHAENSKRFTNIDMQLGDAYLFLGYG